MDLGDQRTGRVDNFQGAVLGFLTDGWRYAVGAEDEHCAMRDVLDGLEENRSAAAQVLDDVRVMHDLVVALDRLAVGFESQLDDIHGSYHARAESSRPYPQ